MATKTGIASAPTINSHPTLCIDVISDVVCPWCYVGKRHLDIAMSEMPEVNFDIRWRPFQLNPKMPKEGMDREEYMANKFGKGGPTKQFYNELQNTGKALNIDFQFDRIEKAPNTLDAHRLIFWASGGSDNKAPDNQTRLVLRLFDAYFVEGTDIGNPVSLVNIAVEMGMDGRLVAELLESDRDVDKIREQVAVAGKMGVTGVPCFIIENKYAVMGAQQPKALVQAFQTALDEKAKTTTT